ncbi:hypothetical protein [Peptoanaerobacter stomatis]
MAFLYEKDLKEEFWKKYKTRDNIINYSFETGRTAGMDLVTFEYFMDKYEFNAFEFKLSDIKKAILQSKYNLKYVHKSWIVLPEEKRDIIQNKYYTEIKNTKGLGVILVKENGYYDILIKSYRKNEDDILLNDELLKLAVS